MGKDVLEVLGRAAGYILCSAGSEHEDYRAMHDAIDRIAELIAADVEYDQAKEALDEAEAEREWRGPTSDREKVDAATDKFYEVEGRRDAALAACRWL